MINYSADLQRVLDYMVDEVGALYPCREYTLEHFFLSMLEKKKCHANVILNSFLMSNNLRKLIEIYSEYLSNQYGNSVGYNPYKKIIKFNKTLNDVLKSSEEEAKNVGNDEISTEHALLAILNPINEHMFGKHRNALREAGIDYQFIFNRCVDVNDNIKNNKDMKPMEKNEIVKTIKSQINPKAITPKTDYINNYTINVTKLVQEGKVDKLIGREREIDLIINVLSRRKKNNVILVGNGGCGKTTIVYGVAEKILNGEVPSSLQNKEIIQLNVMSLVSGTHFRGMMEERINGLFNELKQNNRYILFLDDMQQVIKTSSKEKDTDLSPMVGDILNGGEVSVIGTTTFKDYRNGIENNTSLSRKLQKIVIEPNTIEESTNILLANKTYYEDFHGVDLSEDVIKETIKLSERYITDRSLPDSAIDVIDLVGASVKMNIKDPDEIIQAKQRLSEIDEEKLSLLNQGDFERVEELTKEEKGVKKIISKFKRERESKENRILVTVNDIRKVISNITNIPINKLNTNEKEKIANIDNVLKQSVVGQDEAIDAICKIIKRNKIGLGNKKKVNGSMLLLGPTGCGKTLIAKKLAEEIFGNENDLIRFDMSEYSEKNSVAKLLGSAPGYIGYENGGQLTEAVKNKQHCVILLDEIEKADQEVYNVFLQLFDEGRLTDSSGQLVNFKNVIVLMTSNVGARQASEFGKGSGFITDEGSNKKSIIDKQLKKKFSPEFLNRIDKIIHFNQLSDENLKDIITLELNKFNSRLKELNFSITWDDKSIVYLYEKTLEEKEYGARPIIRIIQNEIEDKMTNLLLSSDYEKNHVFTLTCKDNEIVIE